MLKFILIILDGFGLRDEKEGNAVAQAQTYNIDQMLNTCPVSIIETSGKYVGLPDGIMGNSEVGHMNIGAGRIVKQDLVRINESISSDTLRHNINLNQIFNYVKNNDSTLHLMGLLSDGGVHSHIDHYRYIINVIRKFNLGSVVIHVITDGRDTSPNSSVKYIQELENLIKDDNNIKIASICGRYYAMDRDSRWDRIKKAYDLYIEGKGNRYIDSISAIKASYDSKITDEFVLPSIIDEPIFIKDRDAVLTMNFRADRMRQIVTAINNRQFNKFKTKDLDILFTCMTKYQDNFPYPVLFGDQKINNIFPEILSKNKFRQLRIAETEKYAHVTYFFNGGNEEEFDGESRILIPSPRVATYDLKPEMSAYEVTEKVLEVIKNDEYEAIIVNFANPDMVGHTGNLEAAVKAIEIIDSCIGEIRCIVKQKKSSLFLTADHGNLEMMFNPETGQIHTAHTTLPVPLIMESNTNKYKLKNNGKLADIAPTILEFLGISKPKEMTGNSLLISSYE